MINLYKDPKGENIFRKIDGATKSKKISEIVEISSGENEAEGLRKRLKELESEVKEKDVIL